MGIFLGTEARIFANFCYAAGVLKSRGAVIGPSIVNNYR
jgi:hypothetical protein